MITIVEQPQIITPAYNDIIWQVTSDNYANTGFRFICEVLDSGNNVIAKLKVPILNGTTDVGVFNLTRILESYVSHDVSLVTTPLTYDCVNSYYTYNVRFGEEYGGVEYLNLVDALANQVWNAIIKPIDFVNFNYTGYVMHLSGTPGQFLTNQVKKRARIGQFDFLYYLAYDYHVALYIPTARYKSYDSAGMLLNTLNHNIGYSTGGIYRQRFIQAGRNMSQVSGSIISATTAYVTVEMVNQANVTVSDVFRIDIDDTCSRHELKTLIFLNRLGGFDTMAFDMINRSEYNTEHYEMRRTGYEYTNSVYGFNPAKHTKLSYDTASTQKMKLNSDWISDTESVWLRELISSPVVYLLEGEVYTPVNVTTTNWQVKTGVNDDVFNCEIEIEFSDYERSQRG